MKDLEEKIQELEENVKQLTKLIKIMNRRLSKQFLLHDSVYNDKYGEGVIIEINNDKHYCLIVKFKHGKVSFTADGKEYDDEEQPSLKLLNE